MSLRLAFFVSVIINICLVAVRFSPKEEPTRQTVLSATNDISSMKPATSKAAKPGRLDWRSVESADYKQYVQNLRSIGCPEETIFDIIVADVNTLYAMKARSLVPPREWKFWEAQDDVPSREEIRNQKLRRELEREKRALIAAILGAEALERLKKYQVWGGDDLAERKLAFLAPEKRAKLKEIQQRFFDLEQEATEYSSNGVMTEQTLQTIAELQQQRRAEIERLLTKQELLDYDLRTSDTADNLRRELAGSHPTEQEFRSLFELRRSFEEQMNATIDVRDPNAVQSRINAQDQAAAKAKAELGEVRYTEFLRSQDIDFQNTLRMTQFFGLPEQSAINVYELKKRDHEAALQIAANTSLSDEQRSDLFLRLQSDSERELFQILGDRVFAEYKRNNRWWMRSQ